MFQRILVPLDGSLRAERALPLATQIARASQGMLILLHVVSAVTEDTPSQPLFVRTLVQTQMDEAQQYLTSLASSQPLTGISLTAAALPGPVVSTIQTAIHTYRADLLVLCAQNDPQEHDRRLSGLAGQLVDRVDIPLLVVPEHDPGTFIAHADRRHQTTILVAFDGPGPAHSLVESATSLLTALKGKHRGLLQFISMHALDFPSRVPVFGKQMADHPVLRAGLEASQTKTGGVSVKEQVIHAQRVKMSGRNNTDALVLEVPAKSKYSMRAAQAGLQLLLSEKNIPLLLVPSLGMREQEEQDVLF